MIEELSDDQIILLARRLGPAMADVLRGTPTYWGDPRRVTLGRNVGLVNTLFNLVSGTVTVGDDVFFGHNVAILTGTHATDLTGLERQRGYPEAGRDIVIGEGAWIASNATIIGPCRIGAHAVIGAGSVVIGDVEAGCLYAGVPARQIRRLQPDETAGPQPTPPE